ncbi:MAG: hypothetical protein HYR88_11740 [Verrucomicrobia bacterium]|nr:hypothetical protein [Verrucomicrobiota bacterium]MBI3867985.1 hypothetical protein [Verrucomicrobiota bacterium]
MSAIGLSLLGIIADHSDRVEAAEEGPAGAALVSWDRGFSSTNALLAPGKLDFLFKHRPAENQYDVFAWTPVLKGGLGRLDPDVGAHTDFAGGYIRPLAARPSYGDLILGGLSVTSATRRDGEFQGEYRFPFGLGFGGGFVQSNPGNGISYEKITYRGSRGDWSYIGEIQTQEVAGHSSVGGYGAVYDRNWMWVGGTDGEQWRASIAYLGPERWKYLRPAVEILYVDNTIGNFTGSRNLFANVTFKYEGGFLSHPARLGRAMGPQGTEYGNPLGFLTPTWNRRLEVWEMGGLADFRADRVRAANGAVTERYEALVFPGQLDDQAAWWDHFFLGASYSRNSLRSTGGVLGGFAGRLAFLNVSAGIDYEIHPARTTITIGIIDRF